MAKEVRAQIPTGKKLGRYEIISELGRGAMGVVYKGYDPLIGRTVALKTILSRTGQSERKKKEHLERFMREFRIAGGLVHENIVQVYDVGDIDSIPWVAMEFVKGKTVRQVGRRKGMFTTEETAEYLAQMASGLDCAHQAEVVHRDIKPANIMINERAGIKITDFGIARVAGSDLTQTGGFIGSPSYMSPEQVMGKKVDFRSDIFSLAVVVYAMLTGQKPYAAENINSICYRIMNDEPTPIHEILDGMPELTNDVVFKALSKNPDDRWTSAGEFAKAFALSLLPEDETTVRTALTAVETSAAPEQPTAAAPEQPEQPAPDSAPEKATATKPPEESLSSAWEAEDIEQQSQIEDDDIPEELQAPREETAGGSSSTRRRARAVGDKYDRPDYPMPRARPHADGADDYSRVAQVIYKHTKADTGKRGTRDTGNESDGNLAKAIVGGAIVAGAVLGWLLVKYVF